MNIIFTVRQLIFGLFRAVLLEFFAIFYYYKAHNQYKPQRYGDKDEAFSPKEKGSGIIT
jgi:hypothetical protein